MRAADVLVQSMAHVSWNSWYEDRLGELHHELYTRMALAKSAIQQRDKRIDELERALKEIKEKDGPGADMSPGGPCYEIAKRVVN